MRIFSIFFYPSRKITFWGGAEKRFFEFLKFLDGTEVKITVICPESPLEISGKNIKKVVVKRPLKVRSSSLMLNYLEWIIWSLKAAVTAFPLVLKGKPEMLFSPNNTLPNLFPAFFLKIFCRKPLCVTVHHFDFISKENSANFSFSLTKFFRNYRKVGYSLLISLLKALASKLMVEILKKADLFISVSEFTASLLEKSGVGREKILVSGNGIDFRKISKICKHSGKKIFDGVFVGRIALEKGIYDLVDAWKKVIFKRREAFLAIIGEGPELKNLRIKIKKLKLERKIHVFGGLPDEKMYKILCRSRVFVFPSRFEGWGIAVAEALACGLPVICYETPALKEVFGKCKSVFFVSKFNSEALAKKILLILENFDGKKFSRISRAFAKNLAWKNVFEKDVAFLRRFVEINRGKLNKEGKF